MGLLKKIKSLLNGDAQTRLTGRQQIVIGNRSDGLSTSGLPSFIAPWVSSFTRTLLCSDGTDLPIRTTPTLITGTSSYKSEVLTRQICAAIRDGFTPVVLSSNGQQGEVFSTLRTIYPDFAMNYISETINSGCYDPFANISQSSVAEFFYQMVTAFQQHPMNGIQVRNYINVCVSVFFSSSNVIGSLITGQLNHMGLLQEIQRLYQSRLISEQIRIQLESTANSAQSVSVAVFSVIQDYLYKLQRVGASRQTIQIHSINTPRITILNTNSQNLQPNPESTAGPVNGYDLSSINERKCLFLQVENEVPRSFNNSPNEQCFQWYISKTLQMEINAKPEIRNSRILLIMENVSSTILNWFWWLIDLPNCTLLLNYDDFYSKVTDAQERRQQLIGKMERIYFFSVIDEQSAGWTARILGMHTTPKVIVTDQPYRNWTDIFFRPKSYAHDEVEKPWFSTHEIQHLGDSGIVYSKRDKIFTACYRENGKTYVDKKYKGQRVNFCTFSFR